MRLLELCVLALISAAECRPGSGALGSLGRKASPALEPVKSRPWKSEPELLAEGYGYPCESHEVTTEDGYILILHRIPKGRKIKKEKGPRPVALLLPGFLCSSDAWLFRGPTKDLPYVFADAGYDTWIINSRGNVFSRRHATLNPDKDPVFWNFSIHEYGLYDLPAAIDYALSATNQSSLFFVGHSIGATAAFILCSLKPGYNSKFKLINALAPVAYVSQPLVPFVRLIISFLPSLMTTFRANGILEVLPQRQFASRLAQMLCKQGAVTQPLCLHLIFSTVGADYKQFNQTMLSEALTYYPAGTSVDVVNHVHDIFTGHLCPFNSSGNTTEYDFTRVTAPVALHYGDADNLVPRKDIEVLSTKLPNTVGIFRVPYHHFNHIDFLWSIDSKILVYDYLVILMNKYK